MTVFEDQQQYLGPTTMSRIFSSFLEAGRRVVKFEPPSSMCDVTLESASTLVASGDDAICRQFAASLSQWFSQIQSLLNMTEQVRQED